MKWKFRLAIFVIAVILITLFSYKIRPHNKVDSNDLTTEDGRASTSSNNQLNRSSKLRDRDKASLRITPAFSVEDYRVKAKSLSKKDDFLKLLEITIEHHKKGELLRSILVQCFQDISYRLSPEELITVYESLPSKELRAGILNVCIHPYRKHGINLDNLIKLSYLIPYENSEYCLHYTRELTCAVLLRDLSLDVIRQELQTARAGEQRKGVVKGLAMALHNNLLHKVDDINTFMSEIENLPISDNEFQDLNLFITLEERKQLALEERIKNAELSHKLSK